MSSRRTIYRPQEPWFPFPPPALLRNDLGVEINTVEQRYGGFKEKQGLWQGQCMWVSWDPQAPARGSAMVTPWWASNVYLEVLGCLRVRVWGHYSPETAQARWEVKQNLEHSLSIVASSQPQMKTRAWQSKPPVASGSVSTQGHPFVRRTHLFTSPFTLAYHRKPLVLLFLLHTWLMPTHTGEGSWEFKDTLDCNQVNCCSCLGNLWRQQYLITPVSQVSMSHSHSEGKSRKTNAMRRALGLQEYVQPVMGSLTFEEEKYIIILISL